MRLLRVRVPDFRSLKNVDITFEKDFSPSIFAVSGQNPGANSALLQTIFILLYCSCDPERAEFIQKLLDRFDVESEEKPLAIFEIWEGEKSVTIEFFSYKYLVFKRSLDLDKLTDKQNKALLENHWPSTAEKADLEKKIQFLNADLLVLERIEERTKNISRITDRDEKARVIRQELEACNQLFSRQNQWVRFPDDPSYFEEFKRDFYEEIVALSRRVKEVLLNVEVTRKRYDDRLQIILDQFNSQKRYFIVDYQEENEKRILFCSSQDIEFELLEDFLIEVSKQMYFASPPSKIFLFINQETRKNVFTQNSSGNNDNDYALALKNAKAYLPRFFTYDLFPLDLLKEYLRYTSDRDCEQTIEIQPYSKKLIDLIERMGEILTFPKMSSQSDLLDLKPNRNDSLNEQALAELNFLYGEFKRLNIYLWLKYRKIENSIVLIDDIESGLPIEWQAKIIEDLQKWQPSNQYILATHSNPLRQALPPAHSKPIEPKRNLDDWSESTGEAIDF